MAATKSMISWNQIELGHYFFYSKSPKCVYLPVFKLKIDVQRQKKKNQKKKIYYY